MAESAGGIIQSAPAAARAWATSYNSIPQRAGLSDCEIFSIVFYKSLTAAVKCLNERDLGYEYQGLLAGCRQPEKQTLEVEL